ncbi:MAG: sulfite exporter TauE/SafE family protein [Rhodospirillales bacterium]|nr:sulfite exporter TauE/SafE family protein [Rhodospirillales bacterium]
MSAAAIHEALLALGCGGIVGFTLGLIGGGGSIMATPLLLYVVGLSPHAAIGTGALAVSANAFANFGGHARIGNVRWRCAAIFSVVGVAGAAIGSMLGKQVDGNRLLFLVALLMIVVGVMMLRRRPAAVNVAQAGRICGDWSPEGRSPLPLIGAALLVGMLSGFFGIGGGFLIVPGLLFATGMPMICAIGSSLLAVGAFGLTTAVSYSFSGFVLWTVALEFIAGGIIGGLLGMVLATRLAPRRAALNRIFATLVFLVAGYMLYRNALVIFHHA